MDIRNSSAEVRHQEDLAPLLSKVKVLEESIAKLATENEEFRSKLKMMESDMAALSEVKVDECQPPSSVIGDSAGIELEDCEDY